MRNSSRLVAIACLVGSAIVGCTGSVADSDPGPVGGPERAYGESSGTESDEGADTDTSSTTAPPGAPAPGSSVPSTDPTAGTTAFAWDEGATVSPAFDVAVQQLLGKCGDAAAELAALPAPTAFLVEGKPATDPARMASESTSSVLDRVMPHLGYCARLKNPAQAQARGAIVDYVTRLAKAYVGGANADATLDDDDPGNPINEVRLLPVIFGIDMVHANLSPAERSAADGLLLAAENRVSKFMGALTATDNRRKNVWQTTALSLMAAGALVRGDQTRSQLVASMFNQHIVDVYVPPVGWKASSCANLGAIGAYGSLNLQTSDALNAHVNPLHMILQLMALRPGYLSATSQATIATAVDVLQPYATGAKTHLEYVCTTSAWDKSQQAAGVPGFSGAWNPANGYRAFRFGRIVLPSIKSWTDSFATGAPQLWIGVFATGKGDTSTL